MTDLARALQEVGRGLLLVITGAGISQASGIPTFRGSDPDAIWKQDDVELATYAYFQRDPVGHWRWYLSRFSKAESALPNAAHHALVALEAWQTERGGRFSVITQNLDTLHERAGSRSLIKVHGTAARVRCSRYGCELGAPHGSIDRSEIDFTAFESDPSVEQLLRCPRCDALIRPHVLLFDEYYHDHDDYQFPQVEELSAAADTVLFVGTSFSVGVTDLILRATAFRGVPVFSVDPGTRSAPGNVRLLPQPAEVLLPEICRLLGAPIQDA